MSLALTGGVALAYACGVVGVHRYGVWRRRRTAQGFPTLAWLDWDTLLEGLAPKGQGAARVVPGPKEGGPPPRGLSFEPDADAAARVELLTKLVVGAPVQEGEAAGLGFSGGEANWIDLLSLVRTRPMEVLEKLNAQAPRTVPELYLREWLTLTHEVTPLNLELAVFGSKWRVGRALVRFGEHPSLFFARARASALLGFTAAVLDDVARAVYFSREAPFYLRAVADCAWVEDARPALARACRQGLARRAEPG